MLILLPQALWMWLAMMLVHELGHVLAAWATGGQVVYVNLYPGQLSSTLVRPNPHPSIVLWAGLLAGWIVPAAIARSVQVGPLTIGKPGIRHSLNGWAAFCLLAGGVYLAIGGSEKLTDTGQLVAADWPLPWLVAIGTAVAIAGYAWSRRAWPALLRHLEDRPPTSRSITYAWLLLGLWIVGQWWLASMLDTQ